MSDKEAATKDTDNLPTAEPVAEPTKGPVLKKEIGGPKGPEPTRYGDWEKNGITSDF